MKISGIQYYWLIVAGLLAGLGHVLMMSFGPTSVTEHAAFPLAVLALAVPIVVAYLIVALEIWQRFGLMPAIIAWVIFPICIVYWFSRIKGIDDQRWTN